LIEGMPYSMAPMPVPKHQRTSILLAVAFEKAMANCKKCKVYSPLDWKIAEDTVVQPDMLIVCDRIEKKFLDFPPILVVEILSPATASKDRGEKMELYLSQKVKYYLIIDPQFQKVEVYQCINDQYEAVAINPDTFSFSFEDDFTSEVSLTDIWE